MRMKIACNACGHLLRIGERHAGKRVKCRHCGHLFTVPAGETPEPAEPVDTAAVNGMDEPELVATEAPAAFGSHLPSGEGSPHSPRPSGGEGSGARGDSVGPALREIAESLRNIQA